MNGLEMHLNLDPKDGQLNEMWLWVLNRLQNKVM